MKYNSPLFQFLNTLTEFIILNILFVISCIPIFTIGASLSALYQVTLRESRSENGYIIKKFLISFKENFIQSTITFLIYFVLASILLFNMFFWASLDTIISSLVLLVISLASVILIISFIYTYPLIARFKNSTKQTLKNSYIIAMTHKLRTLALLGIFSLAIVFFIYAPFFRIFMVVLGFSFIAYCNSFLFSKTFKEYEPIENT
jgi:uncharacterized membrane protein YesL